MRWALPVEFPGKFIAMNRSLKERVLVTLAATILAAVLGTLSGYLLGRAISLRLAQRKLNGAVIAFYFVSVLLTSASSARSVRTGSRPGCGAC